MSAAHLKLLAAFGALVAGVTAWTLVILLLAGKIAL
jgi:hypothetical protein